MTFTNEIRREIMLIAWDFYRTDRHEGFGQALKRAWAWIRKTMARPNRIIQQVAAGATHVRVSSLVQRRDRKHLGQDEARRQAMWGE